MHGHSTHHCCSCRCAAAVCLPGRGRANSTSPCVLCDYGSWQPGGLAECQPCPDTTFYAPVDGVGPTYTSVSSTFSKGATGEEWCVPMRSQLSPEAGQAYFSMELSQSSSVNTMFATSGIESLDECLAQCDMLSDQCCFAQYEADTKTCTTATLPPADELDTGYQVFYKLPPSTLSAASSIKDDANSTTSAASVRPARSWLSTIVRGRSGAAATASGSTSAAQPAVRAKMLASGLYAKCHIDHEQAPAWQQVGSSLSLDARTFAKGAGEWRAVADLNECQEMCDNSNVCWGGIYQGTDTGGRCIFRGGVDALRTRSFFALPSPGTVPNMILPGGSLPAGARVAPRNAGHGLHNHVANTPVARTATACRSADAECLHASTILGQSADSCPLLPAVSAAPLSLFALQVAPPSTSPSPAAT